MIFQMKSTPTNTCPILEIFTWKERLQQGLSLAIGWKCQIRKICNQNFD
jgi:hypothetical protein